MELKPWLKANLPCLLVVIFVLSQVAMLGLFFYRDIEWEAYTKLGQSYVSSRKLEKAEHYLSLAVDSAKSLEPEDSRLPFSLYLLGNAKLLQGQRKAGVDLLNQGLDWLKAHHASEDLLTGVIHSQLATVYLQNQDVASALSQAQSAITIFKRQTEADFLPNLYALITMGTALDRIGKKSEAAVFFQQALQQAQYIEKSNPGVRQLRKQIESSLKNSEKRRPKSAS